MNNTPPEYAETAQAVSPYHQDPNPWTAVVMAGGKTVMARPGGSKRFLDYIPPGIMSDPVWLLDRTAELFGRSGGQGGTLITEYVPLTEWGGDLRPPLRQVAEFVEKARAGGWACSDAWRDHKSGWITFTRPDRRDVAAVHLGMLDAIPPDRMWLLPADQPAEVIATSLIRYQDLVGLPFRIDPGVCGLGVLRNHYATRRLPAGVRRREQPTWKWHEPLTVATPEDLVWSREPSKGEQQAMPWVHAYDINAQFLAAAGAAVLSWAVPQHTGAIMFEPARAGLWRIHTDGAVHPGGAAMPPYLNPSRIERDGTAWVTTPILEFLAGERIHPEILDSWTTEPDDSRRILRPWAEHLRDARLKAAGPPGHLDDCLCPLCRVARTVKATYTHAIGQMDSTVTARVHRPDWARTIRDLARVNLLRKIVRMYKQYGVSPIRVQRDCVWYVSPWADAGRIGEQLGVPPTEPGAVGMIGKFKIVEKYSTTMDQYINVMRENQAKRRSRKGR